MTNPPPVIIRTVPPAPAPLPATEPVEGWRRLVDYIPEVWLAQKIVNWVKTQPAGSGGSRPQSEVVQAR